MILIVVAALVLIFVAMKKKKNFFKNSIENMKANSRMLIHISGRSRISRGGGANPPGATMKDFAKFSQKQHGIERIWTPLDPPLHIIVDTMEILGYLHASGT